MAWGRRPCHSGGMADLKAILHTKLREQRDALRLKLDGLSERQARLPRTPTGTNLLGLLKHVACCEADYFGTVFDRPIDLAMPWDAPGASVDDGLDMFATEDESMADVIGFADQCFAHADTTIEALPIDAPGVVPWWRPEMRNVTLGQVLNHMALDSARHAGHADILREQLDGAAGLRWPGDNLPEGDSEGWARYCARLQAIAENCPDD